MANQPKLGQSNRIKPGCEGIVCPNCKMVFNIYYDTCCGGCWAHICDCGWSWGGGCDNLANSFSLPPGTFAAIVDSIRNMTPEKMARNGKSPEQREKERQQWKQQESYNYQMNTEYMRIAHT